MPVVIIIVAILGDYFIAKEFNRIAKDKGSERNYFWWCFLAQPYGIAMVLALPDYRLNQKQDEILDAVCNISNNGEENNEGPSEPQLEDLEGWVCPKCLEKNKPGSIYCKGCGEYK